MNRLTSVEKNPITAVIETWIQDGDVKNFDTAFLVFYGIFEIFPTLVVIFSFRQSFRFHGDSIMLISKSSGNSRAGTHVRAISSPRMSPVKLSPKSSNAASALHAHFLIDNTANEEIENLVLSDYL